jgi:CheY-like chemotaxis protein
LGLSTVYGIIKQTGGFIYPESEPGQGTTFRIFLPRHLPGAEEAAATAPAAEASGTAQAVPAAEDGALAPTDLTGHGTILLVEDEDGLRALNARGLVSRGYTVLEAGNGVEAIEVFNKRGGKIDLVVSDVVTQAQPRGQDHLRLRLCRGCLRKESAARRQAASLPCQAIHAQATGGGGEGDYGVIIAPRLRNARHSQARPARPARFGRRRGDGRAGAKKRPPSGDGGAKGNRGGTEVVDGICRRTIPN